MINNVVAPVVRLALKSLYRLESHEIRELSEIVQNLRPRVSGGGDFPEGTTFLLSGGWGFFWHQEKITASEGAGVGFFLITHDNNFLNGLKTPSLHVFF